MSEPKTVPGVSVLRLHYQADPTKASNEWKQYASAGYPPSKWAREMELDAHAGALLAIFGRTYRPDVHERPLQPNPHLSMIHGWDFGKGWPAHGWAQRTMRGALRIYGSIYGQGVQLRPFYERVVGHELNLFGDLWHRRIDYCDPAGNQDKDDGLKSVAVLRECGLAPKWRGSRVEEGHEELERLLSTVEPETGEPMFLIDPRYNPELCQAFRSMYRRKATGEIERIHPFIDLMDQNRYIVINTKASRQARRPPPAAHFDPVSGYGRAPMPGHAAMALTDHQGGF